jgi:2-dehydropantoate 2-reductase
MKCLVFGAGAIGGYVGGSLALHGHAVTFYARPATAHALRATGLHLTQPGGAIEVLDSPAITDSLEAALAAQPDVILFALKSNDTAAALEALRTVTAAPPPLLCLQNGVDNEAALAQAFGVERVIAGTVTTAVSRAAPGHITVERKRGIGVAATHPVSPGLVTGFNACGLRAGAFASAASMKWSKLLTNLVGNATSAILDLPVADVYRHPPLFAVEQAMLRECLAVMRAQRIGVVDLPGTPVRALALGAQLPAWLARPLLARGVASGRGNKMPSFHIDLHRGHTRTEVNWLHGAVVRHGQTCGIPTPVNRALTQTLEALSLGQRSLDEFRRRPEALLRLIKP